MIESGAKSNRAVKQLTFSSPLPYFRSVHLSICCSVWPVHPHVHQYVHLSINLSIGLSVHLMVSLSTCSTRMAGKKLHLLPDHNPPYSILFPNSSSHVNVESIFVPSAWYANKNLWNVILKCNISRTSEQDH